MQTQNNLVGKFFKNEEENELYLVKQVNTFEGITTLDVVIRFRIESLHLFEIGLKKTTIKTTKHLIEIDKSEYLTWIEKWNRDIESELFNENF